MRSIDYYSLGLAYMFILWSCERAWDPTFYPNHNYKLFALVQAYLHKGFFAEIEIMVYCNNPKNKRMMPHPHKETF